MVSENVWHYSRVSGFKELQLFTRGISSRLISEFSGLFGTGTVTLTFGSRGVLLLPGMVSLAQEKTGALLSEQIKDIS